MLKKLVKYEFKVGKKVFGGMYLFLFLLAVIGVILGKAQEANQNLLILSIFLGVSKALLVFAIVALFVISLVYLIMRYRNNLLKDQGYLMHTLPVKASQLYFSKFLSAILFLCLDVIVAYIVYGIWNMDLLWIKGIIANIQNDAGGILPTGQLVLLGTYMLFSGMTSLSSFYVSLMIGYTLRVGKKHNFGGINRDLLSFLTFGVIYMLMQAISMIMLVVLVSQNFTRMNVVIQSQSEMANYLQKIAGIGMVITVVMFAVFTAVSIWRMEHRLDLE